MSVSGLNAEQQRAVEAGDGPLCIIAGPGTGKTKTLTARIVHLMGQGVPVSAILALTFTNKAAREMHERVAAALPKGAGTPTIATFHSLCHQLLVAREGDETTFITEADRQQVLRSIKKSQALSRLRVRELSMRISKLKNQTTQPDARDRLLLDAYNHALAERGMYDFDDLLLRTYDQLRANRNSAPLYQHILVDEFQDTNSLQYELLRLLNTSSNLCVIGDPLQSIYGFRGASAAVFDQFLADWPQATRVTLTTNYRSVPQVVAVANKVFADAPQLVAHTTSVGEAKAIKVLSDFTEAAWIIEHIERGVGGSDLLKSSQTHATTTTHRTFKDFAVLYRTHAAAKTLRKCLDESGIPYQVAGEGSPYGQPGLADIVAGLQFVAGRQVPVAKLTPTQAAALLGPLKEQALPVSKLAHKIGELLDVQAKLSMHDVQQFTNTLVRFDEKPLRDFMIYLDTMAEQEFYDPHAEAVTLLTVHAAKGLEFPHVFVLAAEEGVLPHARKGEPENVDEERRLFYVAVTRAQEALHILHARMRGGQPAHLSRFVADIPADVLPRIADPNIAQQLKKRERARQKRAQTSLF